MHILNVNTNLDNKVGGGAAERTFQLSRFISKQPGITCQIITLDLNLPKDRIKDCGYCTFLIIPCFWKRFYVPFCNPSIISMAVKRADIIHLMGHWTILNALVYLFAMHHNKPYVVCPAGALPLFGRSIFLKKFYNFFIGNSLLRDASGYVAITNKEIADFSNYGIKASEIQVIPNGVVLDIKPIESKKDFLNKFDLYDVDRYILFMGRLNYIKGPDLLLDAFYMSKLSGVHLIFCGPDDGMLKSLQANVDNMKIKDTVHFIGYVDGENKSAFYTYADLLVVPSRQEAMSIVALEAGLYKTPALISEECGIPEVGLIDNHLLVPANVKAISESLVQLLKYNKLSINFGLSWYHFVISKFSWDIVVIKYINFLSKIKVK